MAGYANYGYRIIGGGGGDIPPQFKYYYLPSNILNFWNTASGGGNNNSNNSNSGGGDGEDTACNSYENRPILLSTNGGVGSSDFYYGNGGGGINSSLLSSIMMSSTLQLNSGGGACEAPSSPQQPDNTTTTTTTKDNANVTWAVAIAIFHLFSLITVTCLVAILFSESSLHKNNSNNEGVSSMDIDMRRPIPIVTRGWVITAGDCNFWVNGACISQDEGLPDQSKVLGGVMEERERKAFGLFSSINSPFLCLAATIISTAFSICFIAHPDANVRRMLRVLSLTLITAFAALFLFMQNAWSLPINNLLLVELEMLITLIFLATENGHYSDIAQYVDVMLTNPLLIVGVLSVAGDDHSVRLILVFVCMVLDPISLMVNSIEKKTALNRPHAGIATTARHIVIVCAIPLIIESASRFKAFNSSSSPTTMWVTILLSSTFAFFMIRTMLNITKLSLPDLFIFKSTAFLPIYDLAIKLFISLFVVIGFFIELKL